MNSTTPSRQLSHADLHQLQRWNTPTIYNGWEQITKHDRTRDGINLEETRDFMPQMGPMIGYAVTVVVEPSNPKHREVANAQSRKSSSCRISTSRASSAPSGAR